MGRLPGRSPLARDIAAACRAAIPVVALALLPAWPVVARASWSPAVTVSAPHDIVDAITPAAGPGGDWLYWHFNDLIPPARAIFGSTRASYATGVAGSAFGTEQALPLSYGSGPLVSLGDGRLAQLILRRTSVNSSEPEVALGTVSGAFGKPMRIRVEGSGFSLAGNARGELLLAWIHTPRRGRRQVWASVRAARGGFQSPELVSATANAERVTAATGGPVHSSMGNRLAADMAVAFASKRGRMLISVRFHGRSWGRAQDAGPAAAGTINAVAINIGRSGRVVLAWTHQQLSEGGPLGPGFTTVAVRPADARRFRRAQQLERDPNASLIETPVIVSDDGRGMALAFVAQPGVPVAGSVPTVVRVSYRHGNVFGTPQTISPPGQQVSDLAGAEGGPNDILTWSSSPHQPTPALGDAPAIYAATGDTSAGRFGPVQEVSPEEAAETPAPVFSFASDRWLVAWRGHPAYQSLTNRGEPVVRAASCSGACL